MKFKVGDKVKPEGWCVGTIINIDEHDDEFPYEVEFYASDLGPSATNNITEIFSENRLVWA